MSDAIGDLKESPTAEDCAALPRRGPAHHPLLMEVAGCMEDEVVRETTQRLRRYRNRYEMLLRCVFTLVATAVPESHLFGEEGEEDARSVAASSGGGAAVVVQQRRPLRPLFAAPRYAMSVNKTHPLVRRFYAAAAAAVAGTAASSSVEAPASPSLTWEDDGTLPAAPAADTAACKGRAVRQLEAFMAYHFLPLAMTHNTPDSPTPTPTASHIASFPSPRTFVLRHYVNEACRTASFLFVDPYHPRAGGDIVVADTTAQPGSSAPLLPAVLVDPREEQVEAYQADLAMLGATLSTVVFTHCYVDGGSGLSQLRAAFPALRVISGLPLAPAGTTMDVAISSYLRLRTVAIPAFSPECLLVEVYAEETLVGLCSGVLWSSDAAPRWDLLHWTAFPAAMTTTAAAAASSLDSGIESGAAAGILYGGGDREAALAHTHRVLKKFFYEPYLAPLCGSSSSSTTPSPRGERSGKSARDGEADEGEGDDETRAVTAADPLCDRLQRVVLLPTHGGYSNATNQLDLYWASHHGDLARMKHSRAVIDALAGEEKGFVKYNSRLPRLPHPPLFDANRVFHLRQLLECMSAEQQRRCVAGLSRAMLRALETSFNPTAATSCCTPSGSPQLRPMTGFVNVVDVRDAKDYHALHLRGAVNVPMSFPGTAYGARRAELWLQCVLVPHQPIVALCGAAAHKAEVHRRFAALSPGCTVAVFTLDDLPHLVAAVEPSTTSSSPWRELHCSRPSGLPAAVPVPQELVWVQHAGALVRLTTYEHLVAIEPTDTRVVMDVRTPYEFKNGSHQHSVHVQLSEMCTLAVEDAMQASALGYDGDAVPWHAGSSPRLADVYMEKVHTTALMAGLPIVKEETSLSDVIIYCAGGYRSLIAASLLQRAMETSTNPAWRALHIADVSGGAFQIMTQRPDLWRVKDRSIICIS